MLYHIKNYLQYTRFNFLTREILQTPPLRLDSENARYSLHSLVCERDLHMYLLAVKSFVSRVVGGCVVAHSDGTLTERSEKVLQEHLPGIIIVSREEANLRAKESLPEGLQKIRSYGGCFDRLIDSLLWARGQRHIQMDSDILTIRTPEWIISWMENGTGAFVISDYEKDDVRLSPPVPGVEEHIQTQLERAQSKIEKRLGMEFGNVVGLCAGFYGWTDQLKLNEILKFVLACEELGYDMTKWGAEQVVTTWLLSAHGIERLPREDYINLQECAFHLRNSASMIHFIGNNRFRSGWYAESARREIKRLNKLGIHSAQGCND